MLNRILIGISIVVILVAGYTTARWWESQQAPVITRFDVTKQEWHGDQLWLWGEMNKTRVCEPAGLVGYYKVRDQLPMLMEVVYRFPELSRAPIEQLFGPVKITIDRSLPQGGVITLYANHRCHASWLSISELTVVHPIPRP